MSNNNGVQTTTPTNLDRENTNLMDYANMPGDASHHAVMRDKSGGDRCSPRSAFRSLVLASTLTIALALTACGAGDRTTSGQWQGTIDTLASGIIHTQNPAAGIWDETSAWRIEEELRIGTADGAGPDLFGSIHDLAVDTHGRIYILDGQAREVRVFNPEGRYLRTIGRSGSGPGEFKNPIGLRWDESGRLWVVDPGNARYAIFDTTGVYQTMVRRTSNFFRLHWPGGFDESGRFYDTAILQVAGSTDRTEGLVAFNVDTQDPVAVDTILIPEFEGQTFEALNESGRRFMSIPVPFTPRLAWHFDPGDALWTSITGNYRITRINATGDTSRIVERAFQPAPVAAADLAELEERLEWFTSQGGKVNRSRIPTIKPAIHSFFTDPDGYLWVQPVTAAEDQGRVLDLFDPDGRYLGQLRLPFPIGYFPPRIIGDRLYAVIEDDLEVEYVVRARIIGKDQLAR